MKVCKFGGTSMASIESINQVVSIIRSDVERRYIIVSAPGKRFDDDIKITDMLYKSYDEKVANGKCAKIFECIRERFVNLVADLGLKLDITSILDEVEVGIDNSISADYAASRGEYLSARILAELLGFEFVDAADIIKFDCKGDLNNEYTNDTIAEKLTKIEFAVIAGFYGAMPDGTIKTFSRGGSDVSGAIVARGVQATVYENWTDVNGFLKADPRIVANPKHIKMLSYKELRELSYMGASVLHPDSIFPVRYSNIPINIKNTFNPDHEGTLIVSAENFEDNSSITGIAGKKDFSAFLIEKSMMNNETGFVRKVLSVFENNGISIEHMPSGIDTLSVIVSDTMLKGRIEAIVNDLYSASNADKITVFDNLALIATVGHGMAKKVGTASNLFSALFEANINVRMIDQGSSELNIIVGVSTNDCEKAISAIYNKFIN